jgi:acetate---CoA ligase (ADP-forming)
MAVLCRPMLRFALSPRSVAVIGASDNPHKVGGRPILYLQKYGFRGAIYPVNPGRSSVQGLRAFGRLLDLPEAPELASSRWPATRRCARSRLAPRRG